VCGSTTARLDSASHANQGIAPALREVMWIERTTSNETDQPEVRGAEARGAIAVAMRLRVREAVDKTMGWYTVLSTLAVIHLRSAWPFAIGLVLGASTYWLLVRVCVRRAQLQTGMPAATQALFIRRYKVDAEFARAVDRVHVRTLSGSV
jgi:hypothetical protein